MNKNEQLIPTLLLLFYFQSSMSMPLTGSLFSNETFYSFFTIFAIICGIVGARFYTKSEKNFDNGVLLIIPYVYLILEVVLFFNVKISLALATILFLYSSSLFYKSKITKGIYFILLLPSILVTFEFVFLYK